jgi:hypothetical protein
LDSGLRTADIATKKDSIVGTKEIGKAILKQI